MTAEQQTTYGVDGMTCAHCEASVREEVEALAGVTAAKADHVRGTLVVTGPAERSAERSAVEAAVREAGYEVTR